MTKAPKMSTTAQPKLRVRKNSPSRATGGAWDVGDFRDNGDGTPSFNPCLTPSMNVLGSDATVSIGLPHFTHIGAMSEISVLQSGQFMRPIFSSI